MYTRDLYTRKERIIIGIPKISKLYEFLYVDTASADGTIWERLDRLLLIASQKEEDLIISAWEDFVRRISFFYPEKRVALEKLRPLIIRKIIRGEKIAEEYWEEIKRL